MGNANLFHPWESYIEPFRIFGNLYFVGTVSASTHLIYTGEGLIIKLGNTEIFGKSAPGHTPGTMAFF